MQQTLPLARLRRQLYSKRAVCPREGTAMASTRNPATARALLLTHFRGITYDPFIGGPSQFATEDSLAEAFSRYGQVIEATIVTEKVTNRPKGFGFVKFASQEEANNARDEMNGKVLNGRVIICQHCKGQTGPCCECPSNSERSS